MEDRQDKLMVMILLADCFEGNMAQVVESGLLKVKDLNKVNELKAAINDFRNYLKEEIE